MCDKNRRLSFHKLFLQSQKIFKVNKSFRSKKIGNEKNRSEEKNRMFFLHMILCNVCNIGLRKWI